MDKSGSFYHFGKLLLELESISSYTEKTALIREAFESGHYETFLLAKLLLAKEDKRVYHLADKSLIKVIAGTLGEDEASLVSKLLKSGDASKTASQAWSQRDDVPKKSTLTLSQVDEFLDSLVAVTKKADQVQLFTKRLWHKATSSDVLWLCRLITHDLRINIGAKYVLTALHPAAFDAFKKSSNLKLVVEKVQNQNIDDVIDDDDEEDDDDDASPKKKKKKVLKKALSVGIIMGTPIKPMLAKASKSYDDAVKRCPDGMCVEIKYDGERLQIHKNGNDWNFYSRNLKVVPEWKVADVKKYLPLATSANMIILDCEVLLVDTKSGDPLPFGTFNLHKKSAFTTANPCLYVFDVLSLEGKSLMDTPYSERRSLLQSNLTVVKNRIHLSELFHPQNSAELKSLMNTAMAKKLEGLIIKPSQGIYQPAARHWLKMKKDYLADGAMADSADLVVLGAYFGSGAKGGSLTTLLLGVRSGAGGVWKTVCKCGNGMSDQELDDIQSELKSLMSVCAGWASVPANILIDKKYTPDFIVNDPSKSIVFEVAGAEFSSTKHHTSGMSIRFPRFVRRRTDKGVPEATSLEELEELFDASGKPAAADEDSDEQISVTKKVKLSTSTAVPTKVVAAQSPPSASHTSAPAPSSSAPASSSFKHREVCQWDAECKRKNMGHFSQYAHPGIARDPCSYGDNCTRKNPTHFFEAMHPDEY